MNDYTPSSQEAPLKQCTKCNEFKPQTVDFFARHKRTKDGLNWTCKVCNRQYRQDNKARIAERARQYHAENRDRELARMRAHYANNQGKMIERSRRYREQNPGKVKQTNALYRDVHREKRNSYSRRYHEENREQEHRQQREKRSANREAYARRDRENYATGREHYRKTGRAKAQRRRALKRAASGNHTAVDIEHQYKRQAGKCYYCNKKVGDSYHVDHVTPLSRGGSNGPENIVISCPFCNMSKQDKMPHEWGGSNRLL